MRVRILTDRHTQAPRALHGVSADAAGSRKAVRTDTDSRDDKKELDRLVAELELALLELALCWRRRRLEHDGCVEGRLKVWGGICR